MSPELPGFGAEDGPAVRDSGLWRELEELRWSASAERTERLLDETPDILELEAQELQRLDAAADRLWRQQEAGHYAQVQHLKRRFVDAQAQLRATQEQEYGQLLEERCRREARGPRFGPRILELQHAERQLEKLGELGQAKQVKEQLRRMEAGERHEYMIKLTGEYHNKEEQLRTQQARKSEALRRRFQRQLANLLLSQEDQQLSLAHRVQHLSARANRKHGNRQLDDIGARAESQAASPWPSRENSGPPFPGLATTEGYLARSHSQPGLPSYAFELDPEPALWYQSRTISPMRMRSASPQRMQPAFPWHGTGTPPRRNFARDAPVGFLSSRAPPAVPLAAWVPNTDLGSPGTVAPHLAQGPVLGSPTAADLDLTRRPPSVQTSPRYSSASSPRSSRSHSRERRQVFEEAMARAPGQRQSHPDTYYVGSLPSQDKQFDTYFASKQSAGWTRDLRKTDGGGYGMRISQKSPERRYVRDESNLPLYLKQAPRRSPASGTGRSQTPRSQTPPLARPAAHTKRQRTPPAKAEQTSRAQTPPHSAKSKAAVKPPHLAKPKAKGKSSGR